MKQATLNYVTRITRYIMLKFCGMCEKSGLCRPPWKTPNTKLINWSWSQSLRTITMSLLLTSHLLASTYLKLWHSNHWVGDSDATVGVGQSCTVHYREEEHATPLYKAWKPVPPGHWSTEISKPYPCALLISHHSGPRDPRGVFVLLLSYHHLSPSLVERATTSYLASCRVTSLWRHLPNYLPAPFDSFEALFLGRGSRCQSPQRKVGVLIVRMRLACCLKQPHKKIQNKSAALQKCLLCVVFFYDWLVLHA